MSTRRNYPRDTAKNHLWKNHQFAAVATATVTTDTRVPTVSTVTTKRNRRRPGDGVGNDERERSGQKLGVSEMCQQQTCHKDVPLQERCRGRRRRELKKKGQQNSEGVTTRARAAARSNVVHFN